MAIHIRSFGCQNLESRSCPKLVFLYDSRHPHPWYVHVWHSTFQRFTRSAAALMFVCCAFSTISATDFDKSAAYRQKDSLDLPSAIGRRNLKCRVTALLTLAVHPSIHLLWPLSTQIEPGRTYIRKLPIRRWEGFHRNIWLETTQIRGVIWKPSSQCVFIVLTA